MIFFLLFVLLALYSVLVSRAPHGQISRFLEAAKRIGSGDFASRVPIEGSDEFAELARSSTR